MDLEVESKVVFLFRMIVCDADVGSVLLEYFSRWDDNALEKICGHGISKR